MSSTRQRNEGAKIVEDIVRAPFEYHRTWRDSPLLRGTVFQSPRPIDPEEAIPTPSSWREGVPEPFWEGHAGVIDL